MKKTLERLWNEYLLNECAVLDSDEEKKLTKAAAELHEKTSTMLNKDQKDAMEEYVEVLWDLESLFAKKAFFKGCEFATSFFIETSASGK